MYTIVPAFRPHSQRRLGFTVRTQERVCVSGTDCFRGCTTATLPKLLAKLLKVKGQSSHIRVSVSIVNQSEDVKKIK
uniref:Uncharacterized protein n=1 Tax=Anguilla anguilla TaxID=7936 RepID=A0A0E9WNL1_ANGAN